MTTINFGNIVGNQVIGLASGLDTDALIKELSAIKQQPIDDLNAKITLNNDKTTQYGVLSSLLTNLKSAVNYLRNPFGISSQFSNIFNYRTSNLTSATLAASSYLSVTANPGALVGSTSIEIGQLATSLEKRSASFNSKNIDATTNATGAYFTAGTFQIGSGIVTPVDGATLSSDTLASGDYAQEGTIGGILQNSINFNVVGGSGGQTGLQGTFDGFEGSLGTNIAVMTVEIGGVVYVSNNIDVTQSVNAGANLGIAAGTAITFTADSGGANETSFTITTGSDVAIDNTEENVDAFAEDLNEAFADSDIHQVRRIENFVDANVKAPLTGLTNANIQFYSDNYFSDGSFGEISGFSVQKSTGADGAIQVIINGETFRATGLGTTLNSNIVLKSTISEKELRLNLGDAAISVDISSDANATNLERSLDYAFGTRELVDVTVNSGDTLNDIVFNINSLSTQTGASASITQVSDFSFLFNLKANSEGTENRYDIFDGSGVLTNVFLTTTQDDQDSKVRVDGIEIVRSSNTITDAIEDVTINLLAATPNYNALTPDSIDINIDNDLDTISGGIVSFLDAYNAVRVFYSEQNEKDPLTSQYVDTAILGGDSSLLSLANQLLSEINAVVGDTSSSEFDSLSDVGIILSDFAGDSETIATTNILTYDEATLKEKLASNFDSLREIFELKFTSSSTSLSFLKSSNNFSLNSFKLDIDINRPVGEQVKLLNADGTEYLQDGLPVYLTATGQNITGPAGTPLDGLQFIYTGDGVEIISVTLSQGIADRVYNLADSYVAPDGIIDSIVNGYADQNDDYLTSIDTLQQRLDDYVASLQAQFAALEQAISSVNNILLLLDANSAATNAAAAGG